MTARDLTSKHCIPREGDPLRREQADELLQFRDLRTFLGVLGVQPLSRLDGRRHEIVIITGINPQLAVVYISHVCAYGIQEVPVMRDNNHRALALVELRFQPANGVDYAGGTGGRCIAQRSRSCPVRDSVVGRQCLFLPGAGNPQTFSGGGLCKPCEFLQ